MHFNLPIIDYLLDNFLGKNRKATTTLIETTSALSSPSSEAVLLPKAQNWDPAPTGVEFADLWLDALADPAKLLAMLWTVTGDAKLVQESGNTLVELTQTANTSLGQLVELDELASTLEFDLFIRQRGSGDTLEVRFNNDVVYSVALDGANDGQYQVLINEFAGQMGQWTFALTGPEAASAVVRLDNLTFVGVSIPVSDLRGLSQGDAETAITNAGFVVGTVTYQSSDTVPAGQVIGQNPPIGSELSPGSAIDIVISTGSATIVVTTLADVADAPFAADGACPGGGRTVDLPGADGVVSLREAIIAANNTPGSRAPLPLPQLSAVG